MIANVRGRLAYNLGGGYGGGSSSTVAAASKAEVEAVRCEWHNA